MEMEISNVLISFQKGEIIKITSGINPVFHLFNLCLSLVKTTSGVIQYFILY